MILISNSYLGIEIDAKWLISELQFYQKEVTKILSGNGNKNIETMDRNLSWTEMQVGNGEGK